MNYDDEVITFLLGLFSSFNKMATSTVNKRLREAGFDEVDGRKYLRYLENKKRLDSKYSKDIHGTIELEWRYLG